MQDLRQATGLSDTGNKRLGTASWIDEEEASKRFRFNIDMRSNLFWMGEAPFNPTPMGYGDDRHITLVSGPRGGKGTSAIIPTLCLWPGSCVVIDPKGENAAVTAERRGAGSIYAHGMGQRVYNLDPFDEAKLDASLRARFNPLDIIDPKSDWAVDDAGQIATAIVVNENKTDPFWEDSARDLIKTLILYVLARPEFEGRRNLISVRRLIREGAWLQVELLRAHGDKDIPSGFKMLWQEMRKCPAFNGVIAGTGEQFFAMADKTRSSILSVAKLNTEFVDSIPIQRVLETSDFRLDDLKSAKEGISLYLTLPRRYKEHYRWLRLMVSLAVGEMERVKGPPQTGFPTLFVLDEFAGLKRMEIIEHAAAQAAGFGVKFLFVVQTLAQLKDVYQDAWETFVGYSGLKLFFQIDDHFTREYVSKLIGEEEITRNTRGGSVTETDGVTKTGGVTYTKTTGKTTTTSTGTSSGQSKKGWITGWFTAPVYNTGTNNGSSIADNYSEAEGTSTTKATSTSTARADSWNDGVHKRLLLNPDEVGRYFSRIDEKSHPGFPGLALALISGQQTLAVRRVNYYASSYFEGLYGPHPDFDPPPTLQERAAAKEKGALKAVLPLENLLINPAAQPLPVEEESRLNPLFIAIAVLAGVAMISLAIWSRAPIPSPEKIPAVQASIPVQPDPKPQAMPAPTAPTPAPAQQNASLPTWCVNATTKIEQLICATPDLAASDNAITQLYFVASKNGWAAEIKQQRSTWIRHRDECGNLNWDNDQVQCVSKIYGEWTDTLRKYANTTKFVAPAPRTQRPCAILNGERICD